MKQFTIIKFLAFLKKELIENVRTNKFLVIMIVFFIFGMMSPLTAKLLPVIFENIDMDGMVINIPEPTAFDSYTQFFKNCGQMGFIVLLIVFSSTLTSEISKGTLVIMVTRGLSRTSVILAKFTSAVMIWTSALTVSALTAFLYTIYLFPNDSVTNLLLSIICLWIFGILMLAALIFSSVIASGGFGSLLITGGFAVVMFIIDIFPKLQKYNPIRLASDNMAMLYEGYDLSSLTVPIIISAVLICVFISSSLILFDKKKL